MLVCKVEMLRASPSTLQYRDVTAAGGVQQAPDGGHNFSDIDYNPQWLLSALPRAVGSPCKMKRKISLGHLSSVFQMDQRDI